MSIKKNKRSLKSSHIAFLIGLIAFGNSLFAAKASDLIKYTLNPTNAQLAQIGGAGAVANIETAATIALDGKLNISSQANFLKAMNVANALAGKGAGVLYGSEVKYAYLGGGAGIGIYASDNGKNIFDTASSFSASSIDLNKGLPGYGVSAQPTVMAAFNMGIFANSKKDSMLNDYTVFTNFATYTYSDAKTGANVTFTNFNLHVKRKIIPMQSIAGGSLSWGGVDLTSGLEYNRLNMNIAGNLPFAISTSCGSSCDLSFKPKGLLEIETNNLIMPVEISTYGRLLYFLSLYVGVGADFTLTGSSTSTMRLDSDIRVTGGTVNNEKIGTSTALIEEKASKDFFGFRFFSGVEITPIPGVKVLVHANLDSALKSASVAVSAGFGW